MALVCDRDRQCIKGESVCVYVCRGERNNLCFSLAHFLPTAPTPPPLPSLENAQQVLSWGELAAPLRTGRQASKAAGNQALPTSLVKPTRESLGESRCESLEKPEQLAGRPCSLALPPVLPPRGSLINQSMRAEPGRVGPVRTGQARTDRL